LIGLRGLFGLTSLIGLKGLFGLMRFRGFAGLLGSTPAVAKAIEQIRIKGREMAAYGLLEAMAEAECVAAFAREHKNPMALVKATELRARLSGLLIDRLEVIEVDLWASLAAGEQRVLSAINLTPALSDGSACWTPCIPCSSVPEVGRADGQDRA
jgi:hypothetical protein